MTCDIRISRPPFGTTAMRVGGYYLLMRRNLLFIMLYMTLLADKENLSFIYQEELKHSAGHHYQ